MTASPEQVAAFFLDIDRMVQCIPGVDGVQGKGPDEYEGTMAVGVGPIRAAFAGTVTLDRTHVPEKFVAHGRGKDRATGSSAVIEFSALLSEIEGDTEVDVTADVTVRGRLGRFGTGVMQATATELVRDFTACANASLAQQAASAQAQPLAAAAPVPQSAGMGRIVLRGLVAYVRSLWRRLRQALGGSASDAVERKNAGS